MKTAVLYFYKVSIATKRLADVRLSMFLIFRINLIRRLQPTASAYRLIVAKEGM